MNKENKKVIIGINAFAHNSSITLIKNEAIHSSIEEERFNREKHTKKYPSKSIEYILSASNLKKENVTHIGIYFRPILYMKACLEIFKLKRYHISFYFHFIKLYFLKKKLLKSRIKKDFPHAKLKYFSHHLCHAISSHSVSPFDNSAILTIDGRGEFETTCIYKAQRGKIKKVFSVNYPHSLGYLYSSITKFLGFKPQCDEYIVMGLSAYGTDRLVHKFANLVDINNKNGYFMLNMKYFNHANRKVYIEKAFTDMFLQKFGQPRKPHEPILDIHKDIAYALQYITEKVILNLATTAQRLTKLDNLCIAGGVGLNCLANQKIAESKIFKKIFIQPASNDAGTSLGAAILCTNNFKSIQFFNPFIGTNFSNIDLVSLLSKEKLNFYESKDLYKEVAKYLADGNIIAWYQDNMEWGPRALGNRSIIASPVYPNIKNIINLKIKQREEFRPFAPSVLSEYAQDYFNLEDSAEYLYKYMLCTATLKTEHHGKFEAVTHIDNTSRLHIVSKNENLKYWNLINEFNNLTNIPLLLNTSFNISEPIVSSPQDAISTFKSSNMDFLVIYNYVIRK